jgi:hypothetical protein
MRQISLSLGLFFLAITSCDVIDDPFGVGNGGGGGGDGEVVKRKLLIEEFTGHRCNNCPDAAKEIKQLQALPFGDQILAVAIHAGPPNFVGVNADYPKDFRTAIGNTWADFFRVIGLPSGMVSRYNFSETGNSHMTSLAAWGGLVNDLRNTPADFKIGIETSVVANEINAVVEVEVLRELSQNHSLVVILTEDSIISPQRMPDYSRNPDYVHMFAFRGSFNGAWGESIFAAGELPGTKDSKSVKLDINNVWKLQHCNVIAYVYNNVTMEIMQAEQVSVIP